MHYLKFYLLFLFYYIKIYNCSLRLVISASWVSNCAYNLILSCQSISLSGIQILIGSLEHWLFFVSIIISIYFILSFKNFTYFLEACFNLTYFESTAYLWLKLLKPYINLSRVVSIWDIDCRSFFYIWAIILALY